MGAAYNVVEKAEKIVAMTVDRTLARHNRRGDDGWRVAASKMGENGTHVYAVTNTFTGYARDVISAVPLSDREILDRVRRVQM